MRRLLSALVVFASGSAHAAEPANIQFPGRGEAPATLQSMLFKPDGRGPFPAVIALHGCGGNTGRNGAVIPRVTDWTARWLAAGYAVLWPDSYGSRGLPPQCTVRDRVINPAMCAYDALASIDWLARDPAIDRNRIAIVGWSNGAGTALRFAARSAPEPIVDAKAVIAFYPGCRPIAEARQAWQPRVPVTILMGAADDWTPPDTCRKLAAASGVRLVEYVGAYHDFDAPDRPVRVRRNLTFTADKSGIAHTGTNPAARAAAIGEVARLLSDAFR